MKTIIGRIAEQSILSNALASDEAELIAVFGPRKSWENLPHTVSIMDYPRCP